MYSSLQSTLYKGEVILNIHLSLLVYRSITISEWRPCCIGKSFFDLLNLYFQLTAAKCWIDLRFEKLPKREAEDLSRQLRMIIAPEIPEALKEIAQLLRIGTFGQQEPTKEGEKKSVKRGHFCWVIHLRHSTWDIHWLEMEGQTHCLIASCHLLCFYPLYNLEEMIDVDHSTFALFNGSQQISWISNALVRTFHSVFCCAIEENLKKKQGMPKRI